MSIRVGQDCQRYEGSFRMNGLREKLREEAGAAETSTIFAWIVVGVLVVFALQAGLEQLGVDVIGWVRDQLGV